MRLVNMCATAVILMTLGMVMVDTGMKIDARKNNVYKYSTYASCENWQIKSCISTVGEVSDETIEKICEIIKNDVQEEAWNYLYNSGGKIIVIEGDDIKDYAKEKYNADVSDIEENIKGYCPYHRDDNNIVYKTDIVIASECLESLRHEFYHVIDYSHEYSSKKEFLKLYEDAENISRQVFSTEKAIEYYSSRPQEYFAEMCVRYENGELCGISSELEAYLASVTGN